METKTEADSTDITEHPHDDKSRPYVCTVCDKRFTKRCNMTEHRKRHTGENVYSCSQCEKRFSSSGGLFSHKNIHTSKYKCMECGRCCESDKDKCDMSTKYLQYTDEVIQERNRLNVQFAANDSHGLDILLHTAEFTVERSHTNVTCVTRHLVSLEI